MRPRGVRPQIHGSPAHTVSFTPADLDLRSGRFGDHSVRRVFLDPCSKHCFATVIHPGGAEMCYHHSSLNFVDLVVQKNRVDLLGCGEAAGVLFPFSIIMLYHV
ncbi:hypothetical protein PVAP13_7NG029378 [Panicum virgatum]|uniref:Uncharacterized protein n=1 Tax=Panicum virgatum TaxID=38727 RepID=A0A8T0PWN0_PANVG|nr:hypothetical protein PVAP13_7NG029378 [Panicum virgatum]